MSAVIIEELNRENSEDWATIYNSVMQRGLRFTPISSRMLEKIVDSMNPLKIKYMIAYENGVPSSICSYSLMDEYLFQIVDFCVLPRDKQSGIFLVDHMLLEARRREFESISCWLPLSIPTTIDVLGEYLFTPAESLILMRQFLPKPPKESPLNVIEYENSASETVILPFRTGFQLYTLLESLKIPWYHAASIRDTQGTDFGIDLYLSKKMRKLGWIFPSCESFEPVDSEMVFGALSYMYDMGVRDILTQSDGSLQHQNPLRISGFKEICTQFEMRFNLAY